jgi:hypothetical protein
MNPGQAQTAPRQQNHVFDSHPPLILLDARFQKPHRPPHDLPEFPPIEQINDDRHRHRCETEEEEWIEDAALRSLDEFVELRLGLGGGERFHARW